MTDQNLPKDSELSKEDKAFLDGVTFGCSYMIYHGPGDVRVDLEIQFEKAMDFALLSRGLSE